VQNVYDDADFFAGYQRMRESARGLHETTIRPALPHLLPELHGRRVVDLGCGDGWFSRLAADAGAASVVGVDPSERMLERARELSSDRRIRYRRAFAEEVDLPAGSADVVVSILALHYVADLDGVMTRIAGWLAPGGDLLAVVEHPVYLAPVPDRAFGETMAGRRAYLLHSYAAEGEREEEWFVAGVRKYHRTVASLVNTVTGAGLVVDRLAEPLPSAQRAGEDELLDAQACPSLLALRATRPSLPALGERADAERFQTAVGLADGDIRLRQWTPADVPLLVAAAADPYIVQIAHLPETLTETSGAAWVAARRRQMERGESVELVIERSGEAVGTITLKRRHPPGAAEPGVWLAPAARERGTAVRATRLLCRWALGTLGLARLQATVEPDNRASVRTLEAAGFSYEGRLRGYASYGGGRQDVLLYGLLAAELNER
jgi:RimJ/RimL family protein N-acetyltransferase/ubiquinone/menaquinone biosynthesis C-methylase UbiE